MIRSMTGFGRGEFSNETRKIVVEIKAVNHRYLDLSIKMPKKMNQFEGDMRNIIKEYISRGKVDVYVSYENLKEEDITLVFNEKIASRYVDFAREINDLFGIDNDMSACRLMRFDDVIREMEADVAYYPSRHPEYDEKSSPGA